MYVMPWFNVQLLHATRCKRNGGQAARQFNLVVGGNSLTRSSKVKYLACTMRSGSCELDISLAGGKFYSQFKNIMTVLGKQKNEMTAVHLMKGYCLSSPGLFTILFQIIVNNNTYTS